MNLTHLERAVLTWFAEHNYDAALQSQCESASVINRSHTGPGQITQLQCSSMLPAAQLPTNCVPNAPLISSPLLPHGAGVDLWLENGKISELEIVTFGGQELPRSEFPFTLVDQL